MNEAIFSTNKDVAPIVHVTRAHSIFKKHPLNIREDKAHQRNITESVKTLNILKYIPILVNSDLEVLDGWNRLCAAITLEVPIYYIIVEGNGEKIIQFCQTQKGWNFNQNVQHFAGKGITSYIELTKLAEEKNIRPLDVLYYAMPSTDVGRNVKKGVLKFDFNKTKEKLEDILELYKDVCATIRPTGKLSSSAMEASSFKKGIAMLSRTNTFDKDFFIRKLGANLSKVYHCYTALDYAGMFTDIYNSSHGPRGKKLPLRQKGHKGAD